MRSLAIPSQIKAIPHLLVKWHQSSRVLHPWRQAYQTSGDPYVIWVAEVMLQQTTIAAVRPKYTAFIHRLPHLAALAAATAAEVRTLTAGLGYYRRFRWMHEAAQELVAQQRSLPSSYAELKNIKGIGPYTAAAIASICFNEPVPCIDGNVKRVMARVFAISKPTSHPVFDGPLTSAAIELIPDQSPGLFNEGLMELGQRICTPRSPQCWQCPIANQCLALQNNVIAQCPTPRRHPPPAPLYLKIEIIHSGARVLLQPRPSHFPILKNTVGFPTTILTAHEYAQLAQTSPDQRYLGRLNHAITKYRIKAMVCGRNAPQPPEPLQSLHSTQQWWDRSHVQAQLISSLDHKAWETFQQCAHT